MKILGRLRGEIQDEALLIVLKDSLVLPCLVGSVASPMQSEDELAASLQGKLCVLAYAAKDAVGIRPYGVLGRVLQGLQMPDGPQRLVVEGIERVKIASVNNQDGFNYARYQKEPYVKDDQVLTLSTNLKKSFALYSQESNLPKELVLSLEKSKKPAEIFSKILIAIDLSLDKKLDIFSLPDEQERFALLLKQLDNENEINILKRNINERIKGRIAKRNRDYYLQEQLKEINHELNDGKEDLTGADELEKKFAGFNFNEEISSKLKKELAHLRRLQPMIPEAATLRTYLEVVADLPWGQSTGDTLSIKEAENILNQDHFGLLKAKERILDFIAVRKVAPYAKGPILCFVGPPGVGKTSLASAIAKALGRDFVRLSLGGVRDETEIKGHRRTYLGSMPGKIIQSFQKIKSINPVFLLDEIDKMSTDSHRGDPASALLETLDPEQNKSFADTYLELPFDLSQVLFIATANSLAGIPYPLLDRMEIIELSGYTELEKYQIIKRFLLPKQLKENGLEGSTINLSDEAIYGLIRSYTKESGVRELERETGRMVRKLIRAELEQLDEPNAIVINKDIDKDKLFDLLGKIKFTEEKISLHVGMAMGLAWTERGGVALPIEAHLVAGSGKLDLTGKLGEVMKESAHIAYSFIKGYMEKEGFDAEFFKGKDVHIHAPEGAVPKDGPSAGITIASALYSAISGKKMRDDVAMTGELTLSGQLLPIGGLKEKSLAAHRHHYKTILIASRNQRDIEDIPAEVLKELEIKPFETADEAINYLFME
ncbi:MAG: endopeptidase La [Spirochaetaceae bacterium]|nr:endopeptidase La [Spirochaetaceae bacterium]